MQELYQESIRLINFPFSLVFLLVVLYWLLALIGILDHDTLDFCGDVDVDIHGGGHATPDGHLDGHLDGHDSIMNHLGRFLHVGDAPVTVILSLLITFMWSFSMLLNFYFNKGDSLLLGFGYLIPNFVVSITLTGIAVIPAAALFKKLNGNEIVKKDAVGELCEIITSQVDHESGQAEVKTGGAPITVNARTVSKDEILTKGQKAVVVRKNDDGTYLIKALEESL